MHGVLILCDSSRKADQFARAFVGVQHVPTAHNSTQRHFYCGHSNNKPSGTFQGTVLQRSIHLTARASKDKHTRQF